LLFLSLHSCKTFYQRIGNSSFISVTEKKERVQWEGSNNDNSSDQNSNSKESISFLNLFIEGEEDARAISPQPVILQTLCFKDFFLLKDNVQYPPRDLPDRYPVATYIFFKSLLI
jgi:hypothetical protein